VSTTGGTVGLRGVNFGPNSAQTSVYFGGVVSSVKSAKYNDSYMEVALPQGQGGKRKFTLYVAGQVYNISATGTSPVPPGYQAPTITSYTPTNIPASGGDVTITGSNFGVPGNAVASLTLRDISTKIITSNSAHTLMVIRVGAGQGRNNLTLSVGGQNGSISISYIAPIISSVSVHDRT
jgi:hypothetical protein